MTNNTLNPSVNLFKLLNLTRIVKTIGKFGDVPKINMLLLLNSTIFRNTAHFQHVNVKTFTYHKVPNFSFPILSLYRKDLTLQ